MAEAGAMVVCAARGADRLNETVDAMKNKSLGAEALVLDQSDLESLKAVLVDPYDIIINSAGLARHKPALETQPGILMLLWT